MNRSIAKTLAALPAALLLLALCPGCKTPSFGNQLSTREEAQIGAEAAAELMAQYPPVSDPAVAARLDSVARPIFAQASRTRGDITYRVKVLPVDSVNSFSLPGGWIFITRGMMDAVGNDDSLLACVIAHEAAHLALHHPSTEIADAVGKDDLVDMLTEGKFQDVAGIALQLDQASHSREDEEQADSAAVAFLAGAGDDPRAMLAFFKLMEKLDDGGNKPDWLSTHPLGKTRILRAEQDIRQVAADRPRPQKP